MDSIYIFFAVNYFAQGMSGLVYEPISYLLKDKLGLNAGQSSVFIFWMTLPFLVKPVLGLLSDLVPFRGRRRGPHIMAVSALACAAWLTLAAQRSWSYAPLLALLMLVNAAVVMSDVVCDGVMVEQGKEGDKTGIYQAFKLAVMYGSLIVTGMGAGWLASHVSYSRIFALAAVFPALVFAASFWAREPVVADAPRQGWRALAGMAKERRFWMLGAVIFLWSFFPFLGTAQFYYQSQTLKLSPVFIGFLSTLAGVSGVVGAGLYGRVVGRVWSTKTLVRAAVLVGCPLSLLYLFYLGPVSVTVVEFVWGAAGVFFRLALIDLAAKSCPVFGEATAFAAYMAFFSLAEAVSNMVGGRLYDRLPAHLSFLPDPVYGTVAVLALVGSLCTLSCWWLLPYLE
jgi:predicted MFS family arabinose efflux permease